MITGILKSTESSLEQSKRTGELNSQKLAIQMKKIADCLDSLIDHLTTGERSDSQCFNLEKYCQELMIILGDRVKKDRKVDEQKILNLVFGTKVALSKIYFGDLLKTQSELSRNNDKQLQSKFLKNLSIIENNTKKIKTALNLLAGSEIAKG